MDERLLELVREFKSVPVVCPPLYAVDIEFSINDGEYTINETLEFDNSIDLADYLETAKLAGTFMYVTDRNKPGPFNSDDGPEFIEFFRCHDSGNCFPVHVKRIHHYPMGGGHLVAYAKF